ncbi:RING finger protein nhl-1 [Aphelenchoides fujianensis]|nr:RING finger protein nhl-1 [Aphelenchoides fujianensis]
MFLMLTSETGLTAAAQNGTGGARKSPQSMLPRSHNQEASVNPLEKIEQLLTCSICLDRYKTPKQLPCFHTYCLPCLDSYADTFNHNLKCPECRTEHSIPYNGAKGFPTNLTLVSFLDIHLEATDENAEQMEAYIHRYQMERCKVCDEKAELEVCHHCDRKTCKDCRAAHIEMLKRDLGRLLNQIRRLSNRIKEASEGMSKGLCTLESNAENTKNEIRDYFQRYAVELKRREEHFLSEVDLFHQNEKRLMHSVRDVLDVERTNLSDACAWVESALSGNIAVKDEELCRYKTVFVDGVEYLRNFQPDSEDLFAKKIRFSPGDDSSKLPAAICNFGELTVSLPQFAGRYLPLENQYLPRPLRMGLESDSYRTSYRSNLEDAAKLSSKYRRALEEETPSYRRRQTASSNGDLEDEGASRTSRSNRLRVGTESGRSSPLTVSPANGASSSGTSSWRSSFQSSLQGGSAAEATVNLTTDLSEPPSHNAANKSSAFGSSVRDDLQSRRQNAHDVSTNPSLVLPGGESSRAKSPPSKVASNARPWIFCTSDGAQDSAAAAKTAEKNESRSTPPETAAVRLRNKPPLPRQQSSTDDKLNPRPASAILDTRQRQASKAALESSTASAQPAESPPEQEAPPRRQKFKIISRSSSTQRNSSLKRTDSAGSLTLKVTSVSSNAAATSALSADSAASSTSASGSTSPTTAAVLRASELVDEWGIPRSLLVRPSPPSFADSTDSADADENFVAIPIAFFPDNSATQRTTSNGVGSSLPNGSENGMERRSRYGSGSSASRRSSIVGEREEQEREHERNRSRTRLGLLKYND